MFYFFKLDYLKAAYEKERRKLTPDWEVGKSTPELNIVRIIPNTDPIEIRLYKRRHLYFCHLTVPNFKHFHLV